MGNWHSSRLECFCIHKTASTIVKTNKLIRMTTSFRCISSFLFQSRNTSLHFNTVTPKSSHFHEITIYWMFVMENVCLSSNKAMMILLRALFLFPWQPVHNLNVGLHIQTQRGHLTWWTAHSAVVCSEAPTSAVYFHIQWPGNTSQPTCFWMLSQQHAERDVMHGKNTWLQC